jgi:hypothetical protein
MTSNESHRDGIINKIRKNRQITDNYSAFFELFTRKGICRLASSDFTTFIIDLRSSHTQKITFARLEDIRGRFTRIRCIFENIVTLSQPFRCSRTRKLIVIQASPREIDSITNNKLNLRTDFFCVRTNLRSNIYSTI